MNKPPERVVYVAECGDPYEITIHWQSADDDVGIPGGYFFDVEPFDCDDTEVYETRDECYAAATEFIEDQLAEDAEDSEDDE